MPHVGASPPPGGWYLPSGGSICQLKLAGCKPSKMAEPLRRLCASAQRQMVAETACGPDSHSAHGSHCMSKHTLTHTEEPLSEFGPHR